MAYVNVKDWSVEQVTDWLKGLDNVIQIYTKSFLNNGVNGHQLLNLRVDDLEHLGVSTLGHQEIILESVEHLRNFHYELDKENLQMLALRLSCTANSLNRELQYADENAKWVQTQTLSDVHNIISTLKPLVCWLDRSPFVGDKEYNELKKTILQLGFEMATNAHRDTFSEKPIISIRDICDKLNKDAEKIIQMSDPMILQPATLDLTTLKKREQDLGFYIIPSNTPIHQINLVEGSPTHISSKIEIGDEIVQVNYQTVVGWQRKKVNLILQESPPEIVLTLKKRPRHTKVYGQIYMKPYRLPSKKRAAQYSRWNENLPSPRLLAIHDLPQISTPKAPINSEIIETDTESSSGSDSEPPDSPLDNGGRLYPLKPRSVLQRRNTITGATPTNTRNSNAIEQYWKILKHQATSTHSSSYNLPTDQFEDDCVFIRDKSASCSHGLELTQRPTTVIGLGHNRKNFKAEFSEKTKKNVNFDDTKIIINDINTDAKLEVKKSISTNSLSSLKDEVIQFIDEAEDLQDRSKMVLVSEVSIENSEPPSVKCLKEYIEEANKPKLNKSPVKDTVLEDVHIDNIIKKFDKKATKVPEKPKVLPRTSLCKVPAIPQKPAILPRTAIVRNRGKLDKSHSTPAYDLTNEEVESPPKDSLFEKSEIIDDKKIDTNLNSPKLVSDVKPPPPPVPENAIKYELGIPVMHDVTYTPPVIETRKKPELRAKLEVPPKPPPRTHFPELYKRKLSDIPSIPTADLSSKSNETYDSKTDKKTDFDLDKSITQDVIQNFEPVSVSTPITKQFRDDVFKIDTHVKISSLEKPHKTSPTNLVARAIYSSKNKSGKKKNSLLAKKRKVSVNDVSPGDISGYLYQRLRSKHNQNVHWEKRWFVLNQHCLYGFKSKESMKAECYIYLAGFTVTVASEVKSRANAFKVYHTGTVCYFSAENEETLSSWLEMITAATFNTNPTNSTDQILYSETDDDSDSETPSKSSTLEKSSDGIRKFNSLKKFTSKKRNDSSVSGSTSLDRKWFFNKSHNQKNVLPVPTAQFRSYRKIQTSTTIGNFTSHIPNFANKMEIPALQPTQNNSSISNLSMESIPNTHILEHETYPKPKLLNHLHASNPSLCNMEYVSFPFHPPPRPKNSDNLSGFVTLKELMNREADEKRSDFDDLPPINPSLIRPDVVYGEIPIRPTRDTPEYRSAKKTHLRTASDCSEPKESSCFGKRSSSIKSGNHSFSISSSKNKSESKTNSSLPRTPKLEGSSFMSIKQKSNSSKSLSNNEQSYEMIYCPQTTTDIQFAQNRMLDGRMYHDTPKKMNLKSAMQYTPMALPLSPDEKLKFNSKVAFELNLDEKSTHKSGKLKHFFMKQDSKKDKKGSPSQQKPTSAGSDCGISWPTPQMMDSFSTSNFSMSTSDITDSQIKNSPPATDYPGLEYPPVFEPETYSLANPQGTLFRKQTKKSS